MKVLFVSSGTKNGKPGAVVQNQAKSLQDASVVIDFLPINEKGFKGYLKHVLPLFKHIKNNEYDIIHSHYSLSAFATTIALWFGKKAPHIVSLMGSDTKTKGLIKKIIKFCHKNFWDATIVKSPSMAEDTGLNDLEVIPNGVDIDKIKELEKKINSDKKLNQTANQVLFAADPSREAKNYPLAEKAVQHFNERNINLKVVYNKSHEEILKAILNTDILLLTSRWEGSPNIIKEAMACNCPAVATDVGDIKWLFGNEPGHFLTTFNPEDVAAKIEQALEFAREHGRTNGRQRILSLGLDSESVARRVVGVYDEALRR